MRLARRHDSGLPNRLAGRPGTAKCFTQERVSDRTGATISIGGTLPQYRGRGGEERASDSASGSSHMTSLVGTRSSTSPICLTTTRIPATRTTAGCQIMAPEGTRTIPTMAPAADETPPYYVSTDGIDTGQPLATAESGNRPSPDAYYIECLTHSADATTTRAMCLTEHAAVDTPQDVKVHQLLTQTLFALGVYRQAAIECMPPGHSGRRSIGRALCQLLWRRLNVHDPVAGAGKVRRRSSERGRRPLPAGPPIGNTGPHKERTSELRDGVKLVPADRLAEELVKDLGGKAAESVAKIAAPSADAAKAR